ncbi:MAG TPA: hypothetical protein VGB79_15305 [Allosphingosinicella sp.]|jgi:hypothetical protein
MKWPGVALVIVAAGAIIFFNAAVNVPGGFAGASEATGATLKAKVVRLGVSASSEWKQPHQVVVADATENGRSGQGVIARQRLIERNCEIGSPVDAHMQGSMLVIDALTCGEQR